MHPYDTLKSTSKSVNEAQNFTETKSHPSHVLRHVRRTDYLLGRALGY